MTPEQVSALSDDGLNRAMLWLYCQCSVMRDNGRHIEIVHVLKNGDGFQGAVNYLTNYNLTMPMAFQKGVNIHRVFNDSSKFRAYESNARFSATRESPLRAACECLVLIALADK